MKFSFENTELKIRDQIITFDDSIKTIIDFGAILVVLTDPYNSSNLRNVFGVNSKGEIIWQIQDMRFFIHQGKEVPGFDKPHAGIQRVYKKIRIFNVSSSHFDINPKNGKVLTHPMDTILGHRPW